LRTADRDPPGICPTGVYGCTADRNGARAYLKAAGGLLESDSFNRRPYRIDSRPICVPAMGKFAGLLAFLCVNKKKAAFAEAAIEWP
jgi:hypothetical protein